MKYNVIWSPSYRVRIEAGDKVLALRPRHASRSYS